MSVRTRCSFSIRCLVIKDPSSLPMTFGSLCHLRRSLAHVPLVRSLASRLWFRVILAPRCEFFDFRSTSNCFVACLGRSITYVRTLTLFPRARFAHFSLLFVKVADWGWTSNRFVSAFLRFTFVIVLKVQGAFGACRSCRRSRRQGVIYHLPNTMSTKAGKVLFYS